jgi:hypothetical protein
MVLIGKHVIALPGEQFTTVTPSFFRSTAR